MKVSPFEPNHRFDKLEVAILFIDGSSQCTHFKAINVYTFGAHVLAYEVLRIGYQVFKSNQISTTAAIAPSTSQE